MKSILISLLLFLTSAPEQYTIPFSTGATANPCLLPTQITEAANLEVWYSADCYTLTGSTCSTPSAGTLATNWSDRSGHANNMTPSGTCTFETNQINGLPSVKFVSTSSCVMNMGTAIQNGNSSRTMFAVIQPLASSDSDVTGAPAGNSGQQWFDWHVGSGNQYVNSGSFALNGVGTATLGTSWHQLNVSQGNITGGGNFLTFNQNGVSDATTSYTGQNIGSTPVGNIGKDVRNTVFANMRIAEFFSYNTAISGASISSLQSCYLHNKYGL